MVAEAKRYMDNRLDEFSLCTTKLSALPASPDHGKLLNLVSKGNTNLPRRFVYPLFRRRGGSWTFLPACP